MTFKSYYDKLSEKNPQILLRDKIIKECGISIPTFYNYLNGSPIPKLIKEKISEIVGKPINELFPIKNKVICNQ